MAEKNPAPIDHNEADCIATFLAENNKQLVAHIREFGYDGAKARKMAQNITNAIALMMD